MTTSVSQVLVSTNGDYKVIKSTKDIPLNLIHDVKVEVQGRTYAWINCPLRIHNSEEASLEFEHVVALLHEGNGMLPSEQAGILEKERCLSVECIDELFKKALVNYRKSFETAMKKDMKVFDGKTHQIQTYCSSYGWVGKLVGFFLAPMLTKLFIGASSKLEREGSRHRVMWLKELDTLEKVRLEDTKNTIINRTRILHLDIEKKLNDTGLLIREKLTELEQLHKVHLSLFPEKSLILDDVIDITQYLIKLKEVYF